MISVCLASYNGEKYIREQLLSILEQLNCEDEIIVSDNCSSDNTVQVVEKIGDSRIKVIKCLDKGVIKNFENALLNSCGKIIFLSDQDDFWLPGKIKEMSDVLNNFDLVLSDGFIGSKKLDISGDGIYKFTTPTTGILRNIVKNSFTGCCMAFRRDILKKVLPFPDDIPMHDWWIGMIALSYGKVQIIHSKLIVYRRHEFNASTLSNRSTHSLSKKARLRFNLVKCLILRAIKLKFVKSFVAD